jgi:hypothetical protein
MEFKFHRYASASRFLRPAFQLVLNHAEVLAAMRVKPGLLADPDGVAKAKREPVTHELVLRTGQCG